MNNKTRLSFRFQNGMSCLYRIQTDKVIPARYVFFLIMKDKEKENIVFDKKRLYSNALVSIKSKNSLRLFHLLVDIFYY